MLEFVIKASLGATLFTIILWFAQSRNPRVAGMMLTFPALNGIGLLTGEPADLSAMATAMAPMIMTNGLLCFGYIRLSPRLPYGSSRLPAVGLMIICLILWGVVAVVFAPPLQAWLSVSGSMLLVALAYLLITCPLLTIWWHVAPDPVQQRQSWWRVVQANRERITGLVGLLILVMLCVKFGANTWAGRLSALPLLPLYALVMMSSATTSLQQVGSTVLLGPVVAVGFVWCYMHYLSVLAQYADGPLYVSGGVVGLLVGWGGCGAMIWGMLILASKVERMVQVASTK